MKNVILLFVFTFFLSVGFSQTQNALEFDGINDYILVADDPTLDNTAAFTMEAWVYPNTLNGQPRGVVSKRITYGSGGELAYSMFFYTNNRLYVDIDTENNRFSSNTVFSANMWYHIAVVFDGSLPSNQRVKLYVNGVLDKTSSESSTSIPNYSSNLHIGILNAGYAQGFDGKIDEVRIWHSARTLNELQLNMYQELANPASEIDLEAYYQFNETSGTNLPDESSNSNAGTLTNMDPSTDWVSSTAPIPFYTVADGNWNSNASWATGQNAPMNSWTNAEINNNINLTSAEVCENLTINSGASVTINENQSLTVNGTLTNGAGNSGLVVKSSSLGTGSLIAGSITSATVERFYTGGQWHLISSPVTGAVSGMYTGLYLQSHDEVSNSYSDVIATNTALTSGQGFALWNQNGDATASYTGTLTSTATMALTRTATGYDNGWNLVGNPYSSSIDWNAASGWTKTNVNATTYCLTGATWATYNGTTGTNGATQYIASGQGFFVEVNDAQTSGTLGFTTDVQAHDNTTFFKEEPADVVKLKVSGNNFSDETAVYFREEATTGYDGQMDAHQIPNFENLAPYIYSTANQGMAINVLPEVVTVPMNVKVGSQTGTFTIETVSNGEFSELHLKDLSTGIITDLNANSYTFDYIPGVESRFELHFGSLAVNDNTVDLYNIYSYNKDVYVATSLNTNGTIMVYDMMGKEIAQASISGSTSVITLNKSGYYVVKVLSDEGIATKKVFIK